MRGWSFAIVISTCVVGWGCSVSTEPSVQETELDYLPSWSPDGRTIAFTGSYTGIPGIYLVDTSGNNLRILVSGTVNGPSWSPDSKWLAYASGLGISIIKANGDSVKRLTTNSLDYHPSWSPDGRKIAFVRQFAGVLEYDVQTALVTEVFESGNFPSWHSNGDLIVLSGAGTTQVTTYTVYVVVDSLSFRTVCSFDSPNTCTYASVSPRGSSEQEVLYALRPLNDYTQVWKISVATGIQSQLTFDGGDGAAWNPDGSKIVYTRTSQGDGGLWIMNSDGTGKHRLTSPS